MTNQESIRKASEAAWAVTTKFRHPHKLKLKWVYRNMVNRCHKPGTRRYECYGGRGISVCQEWKREPTSFFEWAASHGYAPGLQINRKDNDGNYCPENCNFVTQTVNQNNTRRNHFIEWNGERKTIADWARQLGMSDRVLNKRIIHGWSVEKMMTQPVRSPRYARRSP